MKSRLSETRYISDTGQLVSVSKRTSIIYYFVFYMRDIITAHWQRNNYDDTTLLLLAVTLIKGTISFIAVLVAPPVRAVHLGAGLGSASAAV